jgi:hypothetical protein
MSRRALRTKTLNWNRPFKIWGRTIEGDSYEGRELFSFNGPSRSPGVRYNYNALGYMIFYDNTKGGYRTIVLSNVTKVIRDGVTFYVR